MGNLECMDDPDTLKILGTQDTGRKQTKTTCSIFSYERLNIGNAIVYRVKHQAFTNKGPEE